MDHVQEAHDGERAGGARELIDRATTRRTAVLGARRLCARRRVTRVSEKMEKNQKKKRGRRKKQREEARRAVILSALSEAIYVLSSRAEFCQGERPRGSSARSRARDPEADRRRIEASESCLSIEKNRAQ